MSRAGGVRHSNARYVLLCRFLRIINEVNRSSAPGTFSGRGCQLRSSTQLGLAASAGQSHPLERLTPQPHAVASLSSAS